MFTYNEVVIRRLGLFFFVFGLLLLAAAFGWGAAAAQAGNCRDFPETALSVCDEFLVFYENVENAEYYFGSPISRPFKDEINGRLQQYFQFARFEYHPEEALPELQVQLSPLGAFLYQAGRNQTLDQPANTAGCRYFEETRHSVCFEFLRFFEANGGVSQFGFPVSDFEIENGRIVQYFHRAVFSWHPELPLGQKVQLKPIGAIYFQVRGEDRQYRERQQGDSVIQAPVLDLKVRAFTATAVAAHGEQQKVSVIVQDQNLGGVPQAAVEIYIRLPGQPEIKHILPATDENGLTSETFTIDSDDVGMAEISVLVRHLQLEKSTRTSFRIWY